MPLKNPVNFQIISRYLLANLGETYIDSTNRKTNKLFVENSKKNTTNTDVIIGRDFVPNEAFVVFLFFLNIFFFKFLFFFF